MSRGLVKHYSWVCLWRGFWKRSAFESVEWVKITLTSVSGHHPSIESPNRTKCKERVNSFSLFLSWDILPLLPSDIESVSHSVMSDSVIPWSVAHQAPLSITILQARKLEWVAMLSSTLEPLVFWSLDSDWLITPPFLALLVVQMVNNLPAMQETQIWSLRWEDTLEKGMAIHSSILVWKIPWTEEPGEL